MEHSGTDADVRTIGIGWVDPKQTDVCEVEIIGNNSIKSTINSTTGSMNVYGITCDSSIHLYGSGKLDINLSLSTTATDSNAQIYGIYTSYSMSIDGCDVTVTINDMLNDGYIGASALFATVLSIEDSVVKLKIGNMTSNANIRLSCIMTFTLVNIYNSTLEASTGKVTTSGDEKVSCGIDTPNIVAKNSTVKSEGYTSAFSYVPYELITDGSLKILGGKEIGKNPTKTITKDEMADYNVVKITCSGSSSESGVTIDVVVLAISLIMIVAIISTLWIVFRRP